MDAYVISGSAIDCISTTSIEGLDIVINNDPYEQLKAWISESPSSHIHFLSVALQSLDSIYDVILIDTVGTKGLGNLQEMAIRASNICLSPLSPDWLAAKELPNTISLLSKLEPPQGMIIGREIPPLTVIMWGKKHTADNNKVVNNIVHDGSLFQNYYRQANGKFAVLKTVVPHTEVYNRSVAARMPIHRYEPKRNGVSPSGAETMISLVLELFTHLEHPLTFRVIKNGK